MDENPFSSPRSLDALSPPPRSDDLAGESGGGIQPQNYVAPVWRTRIALALLGLNLLFAALQMVLLVAMQAGVIGPDIAATVDNLSELLVYAIMLNYFVAGIAFIVWFYRIHKNAIALGAQGFTSAPGWAAGGWFVPVANLYVPYQMVSETWKATDPNDYVRS